jgi:aminoglycoside/choline kinase family phosphotransferase
MKFMNPKGSAKPTDLASGERARRSQLNRLNQCRMHKYYRDILSLYRQVFSKEAEEIFPMPLSGSNRRYYRIFQEDDKSVIGVYNPDRDENKAFFYITEELHKAGVNVPAVLGSDPDRYIYLLEDLGDTKLFDLVEEYRRNADPDYLNWYKKVIDQMPFIQYNTRKNFDFSICFPRHSFDKQSILWDLNYFKYYFLKLSYVSFHEQKLENDFHALTDFLMEASSDFFLFRDFQSRNIMIHDNEVYFIDYQGGRKGAMQYDLASLLFEAKISLTPEERNELLDYYLKVFNSQNFFDESNFLKYFPAFVLIRILQAFGAYGYRGYFERKSFFLESIPSAIRNLEWVLGNYDFGVDISYLSGLLQDIIQTTVPRIPELAPGKLTLTINSFSYRKGIPEDMTGNGGGFVFDCRALPNPGKFEQYKGLTGKDREVVEFFRDRKEVGLFLEHVNQIVTASVEEYKNRGFEHLMVSFGCTGGQHRSVYAAEYLFRQMLTGYKINLKLNHYELSEADNDKGDVQKE